MQYSISVEDQDIEKNKFVMSICYDLWRELWSIFFKYYFLLWIVRNKQTYNVQ